MKKKLTEKIDFEKLLQAAAKKPYVHVDREAFLRKELKTYRTKAVVEEAIATNPACAGISLKLVQKLAAGCIRSEMVKTGALSFGAGLPGGLIMAATVPADLVQFYAHILRIMQMLAYLYGWQDLSVKDGQLREETSDIFTLFTGVMFSVDGAEEAVRKIGANMAKDVAERVKREPARKDGLLTTVKNVGKLLGTEMTKALVTMGVSHFVPIAGAFLAGGSTAAGYRQMANRLKKLLAGLELASVAYYKEKHREGSLTENGETA